MITVQRTADIDIKNDGWYWVTRTDEPNKWVIMQAEINWNPREISWYEIAKDWQTHHEEIHIVGPQVEEPSHDL